MNTATAIIARHLLSVLGLAFVDAHTVRAALCAVILSLDAHVYQVLCRSHRGGIFGYVLGCTIASSAVSVPYFFVLTPNPRKTFRLKGSADPQTVSEKLFWSIRVHSSPRFIGFENQAAKIPCTPSIGRGRFVAQRLKHVILGIVVMVAGWFPIIWFDLLDFIHPAEGRHPDLKQEALRRLCATVLCLYTSMWMINVHYEVPAIISVGTGIAEPKDWPPFFGPILESTTLAKCWGKVWHQTFRTVFGAYGDFVARVVGAPRGSRIWWCIKVTVAFTASTWVHAAGDYAMSKGRIWPSPQFFMAQPFALMLEAAVIQVADTYKFRQRFPIISTITGVIWVFAWFSLTYPNFVHEMWVIDNVSYFGRMALPERYNLVSAAK